MEEAGEPGADAAEPKKQFLLDRIATGDGFKDAKAHKEPRPRRRPAVAGHRGSVVQRGRVAAEAARPFRGQPRTARAARVEIWRLVVSKGACWTPVGALVNAATRAPGRRRRRRSHHERRGYSRRSARRCRASRGDWRCARAAAVVTNDGLWVLAVRP